jgi:uncharacterized OB-fold protein
MSGQDCPDHHCDFCSARREKTEVARCNHCGAFVINPQSEDCPLCSSELHAVTKLVADGAAFHPDRWS